MKLNRREFLRATGLTGLLAAFGVKLPEVEAAEKLPIITADVVVPSTGRIEIQYEDGAGGWTLLDERDEARILRAFRKPPPHSPGLRIHTFQHSVDISKELITDAGFDSLPDFRSWLTEHYARL